MMKKMLDKLCSDINKCNKCEEVISPAIHPYIKATGLSYFIPKSPVNILFIAESPPALGFFYDESGQGAKKNDAFRNRLFFLIHEAGLSKERITTLAQFNECGYFLADAINCRWDKSKQAGKITQVRRNCGEHLKNLIEALEPNSIVLMGNTAKLAFDELHGLPVTEYKVIRIPFILTAPVTTEEIVIVLKELKHLTDVD